MQDFFFFLLIVIIIQCIHIAYFHILKGIPSKAKLQEEKKKKSKNTLNSAEELPFKELCRFVVWRREIETVNVMK